MALINCSECGKEVSDKAASCPNCGNPIQVEEEYLCCPKCLSKEIHAEQKGFGGGKAVAGALLAGGIGILAGTIGSKDIQITCLKCGNKFKAGEAKIVKPEKESDNKLNQELISILKSQGVLKAILHYKEQTGSDLPESKRYVEELAQQKGVPLNQNSGCAGIIAVFIIVGSILLCI